MEIPRPLTQDFHWHETYYLPTAAEALIEFQETDKPTVLWFDDWTEVTSHHRTTHLTANESDTAMLQVFGLCGVPKDFHKFIKILKKPEIGNRSEYTWVDESTFGTQEPSLTYIFNWLGNQGDFWADEPNDFNVGIVL